MFRSGSSERFARADGSTCSRREFLARSLVGGAGALAGASIVAGCGAPPDEEIATVTGPVSPDQLGTTLPHEHILVDFAGAEVVDPDRYDRSAVIEAALPRLRALRRAGGEALVECTPAYLGRDAAVFRELSRRSGVTILTNTGYYGANDDRHLPPHAFEESADALADRWIREREEGIDDTDVRPGFVKIGVDPGSLSQVDARLVRAACRTHVETGLTVASHTGPAVPAFEQLAILREEGVDPSAWIWVHAQNESDLSRHVEAARRGAWVEFDGYGPDATDEYVRILSEMRDAGVLDRILLSQDNGWYHVGEPGGGTFRPYDPLLAELVPALRQEGFGEDEIRRLTATNPAEAFTVSVRTR